MRGMDKIDEVAKARTGQLLLIAAPARITPVRRCSAIISAGFRCGIVLESGRRRIAKLAVLKRTYSTRSESPFARRPDAMRLRSVARGLWSFWRRGQPVERAGYMVG